MQESSFTNLDQRRHTGMTAYKSHKSGDHISKHLLFVNSKYNACTSLQIYFDWS